MIFGGTFQDKMGSWFSNPVSADAPTVGGGVGKYMKATTTQAAPVTTVDIDAAPAMSVVKKRKLGVSKADLQDFSSW